MKMNRNGSPDYGIQILKNVKLNGRGCNSVQVVPVYVICNKWTQVRCTLRYFVTNWSWLCNMQSLYFLSLALPRTLECRAFLFVCSYWVLPVDPGPDFPKAVINITGHCNGVIFMEAPEEVTWLWLVPWGPGVSIKLVVLTHITINEVEKLRK